MSRRHNRGAKPDWHGKFLDWKNSSERLGVFDVYSPLEAAKGLAAAVLAERRQKAETKKRKRQGK